MATAVIPFANVAVEEDEKPGDKLKTGDGSMGWVERRPAPPPPAEPLQEPLPETLVQPAATQPTAPTQADPVAAAPQSQTTSTTDTQVSRVQDTAAWKAARGRSDAAAEQAAQGAIARGEQGAKLAEEAGKAEAAVQEVEARRAEAREQQRKVFDAERAKRKEEQDRVVQARMAELSQREEALKAIKAPDFWADKSTGERIAARVGLWMGVLFSKGPTNQVKEAIDKDIARDLQIYKEKRLAAKEDIELMRRGLLDAEARREKILEDIGLREVRALNLVADRFDAESARTKSRAAKEAAQREALGWRQKADEKAEELRLRSAERAEATAATMAPRIQSRTVTESGPGKDGRKDAEGEQIKEYAKAQAQKELAKTMAERIHANPAAFAEMQKKVNEWRSDESNAVGRTWRGARKLFGNLPPNVEKTMSPAAQELYADARKIARLFQKGESNDDAKIAEEFMGVMSLDPNAFVKRLGESSAEADRTIKFLTSQRKFTEPPTTPAPAAPAAQPGPRIGTVNGKRARIYPDGTYELI